jgi:hypothetical protein
MSRFSPFRWVLLVWVLVSSSAAMAQIPVKLQLPQRARLDLRDKETIAIAPFLVVAQEESDSAKGRSLDVEKEFERYLTKVLRRETDLKIVEGGGNIEYPSFDLDQLSGERDLWKGVGERLQADLIVMGSLDFDVQDRSGYRTQEFTSPFDGRTYYRQVLVEQTGFEYDILMLVFDGATGELLHRDNFKDFQSFASESTDPFQGMFENLLSLEDRIVGVFTQKEVEATRVLFIR